MYFQFQPELVLVSAGYDSAIGCPEVLLLHLDFVCVCMACVGCLVFLKSIVRRGLLFFRP